MLRAKPIQWCALGATLGAACVSPDAPSGTETVPFPLIGRLQSREGVTDLTVHSFGDGPNAVPTSSYARVVADIAPDVRGDKGDRIEAADAAEQDKDIARKRGF